MSLVAYVCAAAVTSRFPPFLRFVPEFVVFAVDVALVRRRRRRSA